MPYHLVLTGTPQDKFITSITFLRYQACQRCWQLCSRCVVMDWSQCTTWGPYLSCWLL